MNARTSLAALTLILVAVTARADDWPQFGGPRRDGISKEKGLLKTWPKAGPKLNWSFKNAGLGFSSVAVVGDTAYLSGTRGDKEEVVIALNVADGTERWAAKIGPLFTFEGNKWGDGPRGTPTIDGNFLYAIGGQGDLVCLDRAAGGKEVWRTNLNKDLDGKMMSEWGNSESPLIDGDHLICTPGGDKGLLAALDKKTGQVKWRSKLKSLATYCSVMPAEIQGVRQYVTLGYVDSKVGGIIAGVDAKDGSTLWTASIFKGFTYVIGPNPIIKGNLVYTTVGDEQPACHLFEIGKDMTVKDKYAKTVQKKMKNIHGGVVLVGDHVYGHSEKAGWVCQDFMTGKVAWDEKQSLECSSGSIISADDMLYLYSDQGETVLLKVDPTAWIEAGRFTIPQTSAYPKKRPSSLGSKAWSHPAIANGRLFLRDCEFVYCYEISGKK